MVKLLISKITENAFSNTDGDLVYKEIKKNLLSGKDVQVSFKGFTSVNSSFVNSSLMQLLNDFSMEEIKKRVMFIDTTKQINHMILTRFQFEEEKLHLV
ncbi:STAS-like domain-containing protein [Listeria fleischmannii]|uniref:DUF4325 domain-containing protein n=1 Tax=Listeria fleischmannii TaxID=1069827 RepID=A0A841YED0_9LIST|nr:DUF4325 domain-containing protein [Listeria fleischmannii]MBC1405992.1 DUF4325 domain-containing protein [Listeria welshimeri]EIA20018.1 hypothetical protein KKC_09307 [Listeria fleischmannii subsp. coloradonensis]MBC1398621.1 DUF4325 domain-containing protein [Listeria fleischmannii]MBC1427035.1 DUF4325 domain-containing protein [Listeria fleischmannii]STY36040.1 Uncharacterised protein [Listeria fleischmannii subsp. coloradonensis]